MEELGGSSSDASGWKNAHGRGCRGSPAGRAARGRGGRGRRPDQFRKHGLAVDVDRAGHGDAAGACPVLRRPRAAQERPVDGHAQLLRPGAGEHRVGADRLLAGVRHRRRRAGPDRRPRLRRVHGRRPRAVDRLRRDDPVHPVRRVPAHVRGHHPGADQRRLRRAQALRRVRAVHGPVVDLRLLPDRPLGLVGRRLAVQARRARLRRRHRRPRLVRHLGAHRRPADRPPGRQRRRPRAPRHPDDGPRRRPPVVRLVRLQRRLRHGGRRPRGERAAGDQHRRRGRHDQLGAAAVRQQEEGRRSSAPPAARSRASSRSPRPRATSPPVAPSSSASWSAGSATA